MKYFRAGIVFTPDRTDSHLEAKPYMKFGKAKTGISGKRKDTTPRSDRVKVRLAGTTERTVAKALPIWEAAAGESDAIFDRLEGRNLNRKKRDYDVPDPGVQEEPDSWTVGA
jgi:hypothetical protein